MIQGSPQREQANADYKPSRKEILKAQKNVLIDHANVFNPNSIRGGG